MNRLAILAVVALFLSVCCTGFSRNDRASRGYFDYSGRDDVLTGGAKMILVHTSKGDFHVWTKRVGNNPRIKLLLLHGGPVATHEYFEAFDDPVV